MSDGDFRCAHGAGDDWGQVAKLLADGLKTGGAGGLGFLYLTEQLAADASRVLTFLRETTGVADWVGAVGFGVAAAGHEYFGEAAGVALIAPFSGDDYRIIDGIHRDQPGLGAVAENFGDGFEAPLGVVHGDATNAGIPDIVSGLAEESGAFLVGGLTTLAPDAQIAGDVTGGGLSGVLLSPRLGMVTGLSQGCTPIGPAHAITDGRDNVLVELDRRPALDVFIDDIGPNLAADLERAGQTVHVALTVPGSDQADYVVRNLTAIDPNQALIAIGDTIDTGQSLMFCIRNRDSAVADFQRMTSEIRTRLGRPPRAGLYFSCVARGPNLFGAGSKEMSLISQSLGDFPIAGFYANGEIFNHRLYGYTGVLVLFP